jgi:hypothetical protein
MKTGPDAHCTAEKLVQERKIGKRDPTPSVPLKMSPGAQNVKTGRDARGPPKMCPGAQNMKMGPDAFGTAENESGCVKLKNGTRRPRYRRKRVCARKTRKRDLTPSKMSLGVQNMNKRPDALGTVEN